MIPAVMPIYRLPHGQYRYSRHVINLPQDVTSFASSLPRLPSELDVTVVRKEGASQSHRDFPVRRGVVHQALQWLVTHNQYCRAQHVCIDVNALAHLPQDGNLSHFTSITVESPATESPATESPANESPAAMSPAAMSPATESPAAMSPVTESPATTDQPDTTTVIHMMPTFNSHLYPLLPGP